MATFLLVCLIFIICVHDVCVGGGICHVCKTEDNSVEPICLFSFSHGSQGLNSGLHSKHLYLQSQLTSLALLFKTLCGGLEAGVSCVAPAGL